MKAHGTFSASAEFIDCILKYDFKKNMNVSIHSLGLHLAKYTTNNTHQIYLWYSDMIFLFSTSLLFLHFLTTINASSNC